VARQDNNIWRAELLEARSARRRKVAPPAGLIVSTRNDEAPQFSPNGRRIAFVSDRSGNYEIWVSESDGSNQVQLTFLPGYSGSPRWSPDGQQITFDHLLDRNRDIYTIGADGSSLLRLTKEPSVEARPSWSHDGRWIYFRSDRSGVPQIWKMPAGGGTALQVTRGGGFEGFESPDGKLIYYAKAHGVNAIWSVPVEGGDEIRVLEPVVQGHWAVGDKGIYFVDREPQHLTIDFREDAPRARSNIKFFNPATREIATVGTIDQALTPGPSFSVTRDGRWSVWSQLDHTDSDLGLMENFR
jgi:Tol biopolymer transport system component